ncbi:MAG: hypothetical protein KAQ72_03900 [Desulfobacula sp.]|nr:hypothetical protein [Desulfobacula sp.]
MPYQFFSATGCTRCKMIKFFMDENNIAYEEQDIKSHGKEAFKVFYRENRPKIFRGKDGVEFPILFTGEKIFQGVGVILAFLMADDRLEGLVKTGTLTHGWINGLNICAKRLPDGKDFLCLLEFLKNQGLMIQLEADGRNFLLLETILKEKLINRLVFYLRGPAHLYEKITGMALDEDELNQSLSLLNSCFEYRIILPVSAFIRKNGKADYLSPGEAAMAAELVEKATGSKKHPFFIEPVVPQDKLNIAPLPPPAFFKYRTQCRRHMVLSEIVKA